MEQEPIQPTELPNEVPSIPEKQPFLPPQEISEIIDTLDRGEEPGMPERGVVHEDRPDIPDPDTLIERQKKSRI